MAHTPGPWTVAQYRPARRPSHEAERRTGGGAWFVVGPELIQENNGTYFTVADARLIAAAPDLLEAVEKAESYLAGYAAGIAMFGDPSDAEELAEIDAMRLVLRAATSKARGEAVQA